LVLRAQKLRDFELVSILPPEPLKVPLSIFPPRLGQLVKRARRRHELWLSAHIILVISGPN
jgi:hypothetical protein